MIPNGKGCHYIAVKQLLSLLRGITSKYYDDFSCLTCLHFLRTENKLKSHKEACKNKEFCNIVKPSEHTKILEFNQYQKHNEAPFIVYADLEFLTVAHIQCQNLLNELIHLANKMK